MLTVGAPPQPGPKPPKSCVVLLVILSRSTSSGRNSQSLSCGRMRYEPGARLGNAYAPLTPVLVSRYWRSRESRMVVFGSGRPVASFTWPAIGIGPLGSVVTSTQGDVQMAANSEHKAALPWNRDPWDAFIDHLRRCAE